MIAPQMRIAWLIKKFEAPMSRCAVGLSKRLLNRAFETDLAGALNEEADAQALNSTNEDFKEGVRAFAEKRAPDFKGR